MQITITKEMAEAIGIPKLKPYDIGTETFRWNSKHALKLGNFSEGALVVLIGLMEGHEKVRGIRSVVSDLRIWLKALDGDDVKAKKLTSLVSVMKEYLRRVPRHYLWRKEGGRWLPFLVNGVEYKTSHYGSDWVQIDLLYQSLGKGKTRSLSYYWGDLGKTCKEMLAEDGYYAQTDEAWEEHTAALGRYHELHNQVGLQVLGEGTGVELDDGEERYWWRRDMSEVVLERGDDRARLVIDVIDEGDSKEDSRRGPTVSNIWVDANGEEDSPPETADGTEVEITKVPIHPFIPTFDLRRHMRLSVHVSNLEPYVYDRDMDSKLILPTEIRLLVKTLLSGSNEFKDVIRGKGSGIVILCAGPPGTGKTLTSEVYAESLGRPLYSVQCSQLGTDPEELEKQLLISFARAKRWNAILLLDEADVYVASRGSDLQQNAIVGVFLRTLEYYGGVLFMTTNRSDLVDDAVASRCVARVDYKAPGEKLLAEVWEVLALQSETLLSKKVIADAVKAWPEMTGRDVKNMLKLAMLMSSGLGKAIDWDMLKYVKQFKPTKDGK
jgi:hypothetical protein